MSGQVLMRMMSHKLVMLLGMLAVVVPFAAAVSSNAHAPVSVSTEASGTPATPPTLNNLHARIDIGPIQELNPFPRRERNRDDDLSEFMHLVEDPDEILTPAQASVLAEDAHRLTVHGIPTMIVLRESDQSPEGSAEYADRLRTDKRLETAPGADDGMLFLVTKTAETRQRSTFLTISYGARTLPKGGLNESSLEEVHQRFIRPRMRFGLVSDALKIGIRKIIYLETYYPDPSPPLTAAQKAARSLLSVAAPILSLAGIVSVVTSWLFSRLRLRRRHRETRRRYVVAIVLAAFLVIALAVLSVYSQSTPGIVAVIVNSLMIVGHGWLLRAQAPPRPPPRRVRAASRSFRMHRPKASRAASVSSDTRHSPLAAGSSR